MLTSEIEMLRVKDNEINKEKDVVVKEIPLQLNLNGKELATILATPYKEKELGIGFLFTEGFIENIADIKEFKKKDNSLYFTIDEEQFSKAEKVQKYITSGCGRGASFSIIRKSIKKTNKEIFKIISIEQIFDLMSSFQKESKLFLDTGGVHSASLCSADKQLFFAEDIGRHNAVDRVIGEALLNNISLTDKILLTSGRISSEIARKVGQIDIPILISRSAPTDRAIDFAQKLQLTIIGFARGKKMNVYTYQQRLGI